MKNQMGQQRIQIYGCVMQISSGRKGEEAMAAVLLRAFSFFLIILVGILLRKSGFLPEQAGDTAKKLVIYVTLPCAIILNFSRTQEVSGGRGAADAPPRPAGPGALYVLHARL